MRCPVLPALAVVLLSLVLSLVPAPTASAEPLPTQDDIHQLFDQGKYPLVLQRLQRVLVLKGVAAKPYDRHDLLRIKGETHLRMKASQPAVQAFGEAADEATAGQDESAAAVDRATVLLLKRAQNFAYAPKTKDKGKTLDPINVIEPDQRKQALLALFRDEFAAAEPRVKAVRDVKQLTPILEVMPAVRDVRTLEVAATGGEAQTKKLVGELGTHAQELMADALKRLVGPVGDIEKSANEIVRVESIGGDTRTGLPRSEVKWKKKGLVRQDTIDLQNAVATCDRIASACRTFADALGEGAADFGSVRADAGKLGRRADQVLNADYRRTFDRPPN